MQGKLAIVYHHVIYLCYNYCWDYRPIHFVKRYFGESAKGFVLHDFFKNLWALITVFKQVFAFNFNDGNVFAVLITANLNLLL